MKKERAIKSIIWGCIILIMAEVLVNIIAFYYFHKDLEIGMILFRIAWYIIASVILTIPIIGKRNKNNVNGGVM